MVIVEWNTMANIELVQIIDPIVQVHAAFALVFQELPIELDLLEDVRMNTTSMG